jgi:PhzF family phenazine biosynthesis protein
MSGEQAYRFAQVDVFTATPFSGNPVAVVFGAMAVDSAMMQLIAQWTNLSETVFVGPPTVAGADYHARIFAQDEELPFAGHPTLGVAHAVIDVGMAVPTHGVLRMQCGAGVVDVAVSGGDDYAFRLPRFDTRAVVSAEHLPAALGAEAVLGVPEMIEVGPHWLIAKVPDVAVLRPDATLLRTVIQQNRATGVTLYADRPDGEIGVRTFFFAGQLAEDPICGSGNAAVAVHRMRTGAIGIGDRYVARQGQQIGRDGTVRVHIDETGVHVGGHCISTIRGEIVIPG